MEANANVLGGANEPIVRFHVLMQIVDSTNGQYDDFRWSVYNSDEHRLFSIDFDNSSLEISYVLDDEAGFVSTGLAFDNDGAYDLLVTMDMERNRWSALLNDIPLVRIPANLDERCGAECWRYQRCLGDSPTRFYRVSQFF